MKMFKLLLPALAGAVKKQVGFKPRNIIFYKERGKEDIQFIARGFNPEHEQKGTANKDFQFSDMMNDYTKKIEGDYWRVLLLIDFEEKEISYQIYDGDEKKPILRKPEKN